MDRARQERRASPLLRAARVRPTPGRFTLTASSHEDLRNRGYRRYINSRFSSTAAWRVSALSARGRQDLHGSGLADALAVHVSVHDAARPSCGGHRRSNLGREAAIATEVMMLRRCVVAGGVADGGAEGGDLRGLDDEDHGIEIVVVAAVLGDQKVMAWWARCAYSSIGGARYGGLVLQFHFVSKCS